MPWFASHSSCNLCLRFLFKCYHMCVCAAFHIISLLVPYSLCITYTPHVIIWYYMKNVQIQRMTLCITQKPTQKPSNSQSVHPGPISKGAKMHPNSTTCPIKVWESLKNSAHLWYQVEILVRYRPSIETEHPCLLSVLCNSTSEIMPVNLPVN